MIDTEPLKTIDIKGVYQALGYELRGGIVTPVALVKPTLRATVTRL